jgi:NAD(P)-dependent dehydrogenase (short-subunit alcohol dehydrogenase family)
VWPHSIRRGKERDCRHDRSTDLTGRVALVVGASRGIGAGAARAFAHAGAAVAVAARDERALSSVAGEIEEQGGRAVAIPADVTDPASIERLVGRTIEAFGRLDSALNNAAGGGHGPTPLAEVTVDDYDSALEVSLRGVFLAMKFEVPAMLETGGGAIVNMTSTAGLEAVAGLAGYVSSKHGVVGLTKVAALDYAEHGVRVNAIAPGPILTDRLAEAGEEMQQRAGMAMPMRRIGQVEEVAAAVVWLCSDQASFITGATLPIDGGKLAGMAPFSR